MSWLANEDGELTVQGAWGSIRFRGDIELLILMSCVIQTNIARMMGWAVAERLGILSCREEMVA